MTLEEVTRPSIHDLCCEQTWEQHHLMKEHNMLIDESERDLIHVRIEADADSASPKALVLKASAEKRKVKSTGSITSHLLCFRLCFIVRAEVLLNGARRWLQDTVYFNQEVYTGNWVFEGPLPKVNFLDKEYIPKLKICDSKYFLEYMVGRRVSEGWQLCANSTANQHERLKMPTILFAYLLPHSRFNTELCCPSPISKTFLYSKRLPKGVQIQLSSTAGSRPYCELTMSSTPIMKGDEKYRAQSLGCDACNEDIDLADCDLEY